MSCPFVFACDERFAMPLATALRSVVDSNRSVQPLDFYVLTDGFSAEMREKVSSSLPKNSASIQWIELDLSNFQGLWTLPYVSKVTYARLLIPQIFPETVDRVLYLDCDLLVLDDLGPLLETDLSGSPLGAVLDVWDTDRKVDPAGSRSPPVHEYFNAGVLLINLPEWRRENISGKALDYLSRHPDTVYSDQDALNFACDKRWKKLDKKWNFHDLALAKVSERERPKIAHFITKSKPWIPKYLNPNARFYDSYRRRTRFARTSRDVLRDEAQRVWYYLRHVLKQIPVLKTAHDFIKTIFQCTKLAGHTSPAK